MDYPVYNPVTKDFGRGSWGGGALGDSNSKVRAEKVRALGSVGNPSEDIDNLCESSSNFKHRENLCESSGNFKHRENLCESSEFQAP